MRSGAVSHPISPFPEALLSSRIQLPFAGQGARDTFVDLLWVLFFVGASSAARPSGILNVERYFWLAADFVVLIFLIRDYRPFLTLALENKILMSWPVIACLSALWSYNPAISLYHGLQLFMTTMVGFQFLMQVDRQRIPKLVYMGLLVCLISSIAFKFLNSRAAYDVNGAFMGVFTQKNVLGSMMTLLIFTSACLFLSRWRPFLTLGTAAAAAVVLVISKSGTGLITTVLTLLPIVLAFFLRRGGRTLAFGTGLILLAAGAACAIVAFLEIDVIGLVLSSVGKDSTLTGRTILWSFGMDAFETHPWLGFGYKGYWESTQSTVFYLRYVIGQNLWFFHNNFIEVAVAFGVMGPILLIAGIAQAFSRSLRVFVRDHQYLSLWYVLFVICVMLDAMVEYPLFLNHGLYQFLFVAVLASSSRAMTGPRRVLAAAGESK